MEWKLGSKNEWMNHFFKIMDKAKQLSIKQITSSEKPEVSSPYFHHALEQVVEYYMQHACLGIGNDIYKLEYLLQTYFIWEIARRDNLYGLLLLQKMTKANPNLEGCLAGMLHEMKNTQYDYKWLDDIAVTADTSVYAVYVKEKEDLAHMIDEQGSVDIEDLNYPVDIDEIVHKVYELIPFNAWGVKPISPQEYGIKPALVKGSTSSSRSSGGGGGGGGAAANSVEKHDVCQKAAPVAVQTPRRKRRYCLSISAFWRLKEPVRPALNQTP